MAGGRKASLLQADLFLRDGQQKLPVWAWFLIYSRKKNSWTWNGYIWTWSDPLKINYEKNIKFGEFLGTLDTQNHWIKLLSPKSLWKKSCISRSVARFARAPYCLETALWSLARAKLTSQESTKFSLWDVFWKTCICSPRKKSLAKNNTITSLMQTWGTWATLLCSWPWDCEN